MGIIDSFISLNIQKLFLSGRIDKVYERIYRIAEKIAIHEVEQRWLSIINKTRNKYKKTEHGDWNICFDEESVKYKEKRIQYHINRMENLLKLREEISKKTCQE